DGVADHPAGGAGPRGPRGQDMDMGWHNGSFAGSDRFAEVAAGFQVRVDRGQPPGHRARQARDGLDSPGGRDQRLPDRPEVEDDPEQADRGDRDDQRGDDQRRPGGCWHDRSPYIYLGEELGDGTGVPDRSDRDFLDGGVGDGQRLRHAVEFADEGYPAGQDVVGGAADPLHRRQDAVEQEDDHGQHHEQQNRVPYPPQNHDWLSSLNA